MGNNDSSVETFLQWIKASDNIVFFGGAGVSTESGIPDFRSVWLHDITKFFKICHLIADGCRT